MFSSEQVGAGLFYAEGLGHYLAIKRLNALVSDGQYGFSQCGIL
jgi:hypothetical protein